MEKIAIEKLGYAYPNERKILYGKQATDQANTVF